MANTDQTRIDLRNDGPSPMDYEFAVVSPYRPDPSVPFEIEWIEE